MNIRAKIEVDEDIDLFNGDFINVTGCNYFIYDVAKVENNIYSIKLNYVEPKYFFENKKKKKE